MKYYYYEIILRGNFASASDIIRLLILYLHGGIYVDTDTLPNTDGVFRRLNHFIEKNEIIEDDFILLYKTKCILKKLNSQDYGNDECFNNDRDETEIIKINYQEIFKLIELDVAKFSLEMILPLVEVYVHKNLLSIGSLRRLKGIYFNNFMFSHAGSKAINIILRTMKKRYKFIEKNNCIFYPYNDDKQTGYLTRLLTWRTELITKNYCVTSVLTGPGLIIEVLLGLAFQLLELEHLTEPSSVAEFMQDDKFGIALYQHNLDTPQGLYSTWRK